MLLIVKPGTAVDSPVHVSHLAVSVSIFCGVAKASSDWVCLISHYPHSGCLRVIEDMPHGVAVRRAAVWVGAAGLYNGSSFVACERFFVGGAFVTMGALSGCILHDAMDSF